MARLCLVSAGKDESSPGVLSLGIELEAVGDNGDQAALRWALGLAHLQQALLFTSRHLRQLISQKNSQGNSLGRTASLRAAGTAQETKAHPTRKLP